MPAAGPLEPSRGFQKVPEVKMGGWKDGKGFTGGNGGNGEAKGAGDRGRDFKFEI